MWIILCSLRAVGYFYEKNYTECLELLRLIENQGIVDIPTVFLKARVLSAIDDPGYRILFDAILKDYLPNESSENWTTVPRNTYREEAIRGYIQG